jgi:hypothetical protein
MNNRILRQQLFIIVLTFVGSISYGQTFEGWLTYKMEALNPNPKMIPDSTWQKGIKEQFGERGHIVQKYYYKKDKYISEIDAGKQTGFQAYNVKDKLLYSWQINSDTAITVDSRKSMDELVEIIDNEAVDTILGIPCKSITVKSKMGQMTLWYNSNYFKMDASMYKGHKYGHWGQILKKTACLPLRMEQKGFMAYIVQTAIDYKEEPISDNQFIIPKFKTIIENPIN